MLFSHCLPWKLKPWFICLARPKIKVLSRNTRTSIAFAVEIRLEVKIHQISGTKITPVLVWIHDISSSSLVNFYMKSNLNGKDSASSGISWQNLFFGLSRQINFDLNFHRKWWLCLSVSYISTGVLNYFQLVLIK